ncbi:hypothetical protein B296_00008407 [Ensete ventricosum]|uniref:Uncharacterized protein n=1 Tax=Ensete ventricosum TaxID=4639 RepID=A0A427AW64_ENSVE|nr:hypothetical protein B296_00008407 [Ensete ventricosum]
MAERDYALEMWRLLDPDSSLINSSKLLDRIVCVKSGMSCIHFAVIYDILCNISPKEIMLVDFSWNSLHLLDTIY